MTGPVVGVLGGGQLARMLALDAARLGLRLRVWESSRDCCASQVAEVFHADFTDHARATDFVGGLSCCTLEFENVPAALVAEIARHVPTHPSAYALTTAQDRLNEKTLFRKLGIPTPEFVAIDDPAGLRAAAVKLGLPAVLKTRRMGYDGKGQFVLRDEADIERARVALSQTNPPPATILEKFVPFVRELSIIAVRSAAGETAFYPLTQNHHAGGMLRLSIAPAPGVSGVLQEHARSLAQKVMNDLAYVGVLAIEFFHVPGSPGEFVANELAPRVHNSGHWTQDGCACSQFENHLRAVLGWPLGDTAARGVSAMVNIIGDLPSTQVLAGIEGLKIHLYGKQPRPNRKVGHLNIVAPTLVELRERVEQLRGLGLAGVELPEDEAIGWDA